MTHIHVFVSHQSAGHSPRLSGRRSLFRLLLSSRNSVIVTKAKPGITQIVLQELTGVSFKQKKINK